MATKHGQRLTDEETEELLAYKNAGVQPPEKFDNVVFDNASRGDSFYRWKTAEEEKKGEERAKAQAAAVDRQAKMAEKIRKDAMERGIPVVPERPVDTEQGRQVAGQTSPRDAATATAAR